MQFLGVFRGVEDVEEEVLPVGEKLTEGERRRAGSIFSMFGTCRGDKLSLRFGLRKEHSCQ